MKKLICLLVATMICLTLGGCYDSKEISRIAFVMAVGFDTDSYSFQIAKPSAFESEVSDESPFFTTTVTAPNVYMAMDILNSKISEKCDYSHIKMVIFSKEKLQKGIGDDIKSMLKSNDFHPNTRISMCEGKASEYMKNMEIPLDANPAEYYENIFKQNFTEYSPDTTLKDFQKSYQTQSQATAIPVINTDHGMAITKNYKLSGMANTKEVLIFNMLTQKNFDGNYPIDDTTVVRLKKQKCIFNVKLSDHIPEISVKLTVEGNLIWAEENTDKAKTEQITKDKLQMEIRSFLEKCSKEYKADITGFYKYAKKGYMTTQSWEQANWQERFEKAKYNIIVETKIKREGLNIN